MKPPRLSILRLMGVVGLIAVGLAATRYPTAPVASLLFTLALMGAAWSTVAAIVLTGRSRATSAGAAVFGWAYLAVTFGPFPNGNGVTCPPLLTHAVYDWVSDWQGDHDPLDALNPALATRPPERENSKPFPDRLVRGLYREVTTETTYFGAGTIPSVADTFDAPAPKRIAPPVEYLAPRNPVSTYADLAEASPPSSASSGPAKPRYMTPPDEDAGDPTVVPARVVPEAQVAPAPPSPSAFGTPAAFPITTGVTRTRGPYLDDLDLRRVVHSLGAIGFLMIGGASGRLLGRKAAG